MFRRGSVAFILALVAMTGSLSGCDGGFNFSAQGSIEDATVAEVFRGLGMRFVSDGEDEDQAEVKLKLTEQAAVAAGIDTKAKLLDLLSRNPHYSDVKLSAIRSETGRGEATMARVTFKVDRSYDATLIFLVREARIFGPLRKHWLPLLMSFAVSDAKQDPVNVFADDAVALATVLAPNPEEFAKLVGRAEAEAQKAQTVAKAEQAKQDAERRAQVEKNCSQTAQEGEGDFEVDPSLSDDAKAKAYEAHRRLVKEDIAKCVQERLGQQ